MAQLVAGWGPEKPRLVAPYLDEFAQHGAVPVDRRAFDRTLAHCEIMRVLQVLYWWEGPYENLAFVDKLLDEMQIACNYLDSEGVMSDRLYPRLRRVACVALDRKSVV